MIFFLSSPLSSGQPALAAASWIRLTYHPDPPNIEYNAMRGLIPGFGPGLGVFPHSMELSYIPLCSTMLGIDHLNWNAFEYNLNRIAGNGKQAIPRFYLDYPQKPVATPQFLIDRGLEMELYGDYGNTGSQCPNYRDKRLIDALVNFIQAFGYEYDGDPRIAFIQIGIYGFWGEWHNHPNKSLPDMDQSDKDKIIATFTNAFERTIIQARDPLGTTDSNLKQKTGYHDDSFCFETLKMHHSFWEKIVSNGLIQNYLTKPIGGEIYPAVQESLWYVWPPNTRSGQDWEDCIRTTHCTYLLNHYLFENIRAGTGSFMNGLRGHKQLGYNFYVREVRLNVAQSGNFNMDIRIENQGIAPFYYNWKVEMALIQPDSLISLGAQNLFISNIKPGMVCEKNFISSAAIPAGNYKLLMRIVNPLSASHENARAIRFLNKGQDKDENGWLTVGNLAVSNPEHK